MLWEVDIYPREGQPDLAAHDVATAAAELHLAQDLPITSARGYLIQGNLSREQITRIADELLADRVVERTVVAPIGDSALTQLPGGGKGDSPHLPERPFGCFAQMGTVPFSATFSATWIHVLPKPGVMDPVAQSAMEAIADLGIRAEAVRTLKKYAWRRRRGSRRGSGE